MAPAPRPHPEFNPSWPFPHVGNKRAWPALSIVGLALSVIVVPVIAGAVIWLIYWFLLWLIRRYAEQIRSKRNDGVELGNVQAGPRADQEQPAPNTIYFELGPELGRRPNNRTNTETNPTINKATKKAFKRRIKRTKRDRSILDAVQEEETEADDDLLPLDTTQEDNGQENVPQRSVSDDETVAIRRRATLGHGANNIEGQRRKACSI